MNESVVKQARLSDTLDYIIDSSGNRVNFDDPRIVHIGAVDGSPYAKQLMINLYKKHGRKLRTIPATCAETMQPARRFCSGRECVPMTAMAGAVLNDIAHYRCKDELSIYFTLDQNGPCQNGAWPVVWESIAHRLNPANAVFGVWPKAENQWLGLGDDIVKEFVACYMLGDLFDEAKNALQVVAQDAARAMDAFEGAFDKFSRCLAGDGSIHASLNDWARAVARIPRKTGVGQTPKVLLFGGLNLQFVHYPMTAYFIEQGIIPKVVDATEGMLWLISETVLRYAYKLGRTSPESQFSIPRLMMSWVRSRIRSMFWGHGGRDEAAGALKTRIGMLIADRMIRRFRSIMSISGLMVDAHAPFVDLAVAGHRYATYNGFTETPVTAGRYVHAVKTGIYDGLINVGSFNCQPAMNAQAVIRPLANRDDMPYAAIDCEGPFLSANQRRLLEVVAVQARRRKAMRNG